MTLPLAVVGLSLSITGAGPSAGQQVSPEAVVTTVDTVHVAAHFHLLTPVARQLIGDGLLGSPTFRALVRELAETDIIVLIATGRWEPEEGRCHANLRFLGGGPHARFVRVWVDAWWTTRREQIALLAHELRHAVEIGLEPAARDATAVAALFRRIGHESSDRGFETLAARETGAAVCEELGSSMPATPTRTTVR
jgi:hypothetical protein